MKRSFWLPLIALFFLFSESAQALVTEVGLNYGRKRTSFDADNYFDSESITGSLSLYFMETIALELSYTSAVGVREEKLKSGTTVISQQTVVQTTQVYGSDLIWVLASRKAMFQPYIKGGAAQIKRVQEVKVNSLQTYTLEPETAIVPSYGFGFKVALAQGFGVKVGYDAWQTPLGGGQVSQDASVRAGVTWMF